MNDYVAFIELVLRDAAKIALQNFGKVSGTTKEGDNNQVLTETDIAIGNLIVERIKDVFPDHNIIDEEAGIVDNGSKFTWVVDPIDGTSNFASRQPDFGIMIGLLEANKPIAGGIVQPVHNKLFLAEANNGSTCNGVRIQVTSQPELSKVLVAYGIDGYPNKPQKTRQECEIVAEVILGIRDLRSSGSEAIDSMYVAEGSYGGRLNRTSKIWDNVAPQIIIQEAGGIYTDFFGKSIDYSNPLSKVDDNFTMCAAAPAIHAQLMRIISK